MISPIVPSISALARFWLRLPLLASRTANSILLQISFASDLLVTPVLRKRLLPAASVNAQYQLARPLLRWMLAIMHNKYA